MSVTDSAIYVDGVRVGSPTTLQETYRALGSSGGDAWIAIRRPDDAELASVAEEFDLHPLAVEDAMKGHQRPKLERYGDTLFTVLRPAWYDDAREQVGFGEIHLFTGDRFTITVRRADRPSMTVVRQRLEADPPFLARGSEAVLTAVLDAVVDGYAPVAEGLENDVDQVEDQLFSGSADPALSQRIYRLLSEVMGFQRAIGPLPAMLEDLFRGSARYDTDDEIAARLRDVLDHTTRVIERVDTLRTLLDNALTVHATLISLDQNEAMRRMSEESLEQGAQTKRISAWAAVLFTPTMVAAIYGMNFDDMPELHWAHGYPAALGLMVTLAVGLWGLFKYRRIL